MLDPEVLKSREIVKKYKELNEKTVEKVKIYDPKQKIWRFERVQTDPRAIEFPISRPESRKDKTKKEKPVPVSEKTRTTIKKLILLGVTTEQIMRQVGITKEAFLYQVKLIRTDDPSVPRPLTNYTKEIKEREDKVRELMMKGIRPFQIAKELNITASRAAKIAIRIDPEYQNSNKMKLINMRELSNALGISIKDLTKKKVNQVDLMRRKVLIKVLYDKGFTYKAISMALCLSSGTVNYHKTTNEQFFKSNPDAVQMCRSLKALLQDKTLTL